MTEVVEGDNESVVADVVVGVLELTAAEPLLVETALVIEEQPRMRIDNAKRHTLKVFLHEHIAT